MVIDLLLLSVMLIGSGGDEAAIAHPPVRDQMRAAANLRRDSFKKDPAEKRRILLEVVKAYDQVVRDFPQSREEVAEAWFRKGEILRSLKEDAQAMNAFAMVIDFKDQPRFRARALIECGHLKRRAGDWKSASTYFQQVLAEHKDLRSEYSTAWTWSAKALLADNHRKEGRDKLLAFEEEFPEYAAKAIQNVDAAALSLIEDGQQAEAQTLLEACRTRMNERAEQEDSLADDIHRALQRMKAPVKLGGKAGKAAPPQKGGDDDDDDGA